MSTGFEIQIRSNKEQCVAVSDVDASKLSPRQRFTMAHEITHTFFYDPQQRPVRPTPRKQLLEELCNYGAQRLLLPEFLLQREIGSGGRLDSLEMALNLADVARVSTNVVVRRLDVCDRLKEGDYALLILQKREDGTMVTLGACLSGIFSTLTRPKLYAEPPAWILRLAPQTRAMHGNVLRVPRDAQWDYVSRVVAKKTRPNEIFVELRLDLKPKVVRELESRAQFCTVS